MNPHASWLLTSVIESPYPVGLLSRSPATIQEAFNRPAHRMGPDLLLQTLLELWQTGYLQCGECEEITVGPTAPHGRMHPNRARLQEALRHERDLYYGVTLLGAHQWETLARPRWHQFTRLDGDGTTIDGGSRAIVAELLALSQGMYQHIIMESITWTDLVPWPATYWKTLPHGYRVQFQYRGTGPASIQSAASAACWQRWCAAVQWYDDPVALPGT